MRAQTQKLLFVGASLLSTVAVALCRWALEGPAWQLPVAGIELRLQDPRGLCVAALMPLVFWTARHSLADLPPVQRWLGAGSRSLLLLCLGVALARPVTVDRSTAVSTVFLIDVSDSVSNAGLVEAHAKVEAARAARGENHVQLVTFAGGARRIGVPDDGTRLPALERHASSSDQSNIQAALRLALGLFKPDHLRRAVVISDGLETHGHALAEAARALGHATRVSTIALASGPPPETGIRAVQLPKQLRVGAPFTIRAEVFATQATDAGVKLFQNNGPNGLDATRELSLEPGVTTIEFRSVVHVPGATTYRLEIEPGGEDSFEANNRFSTSVDVPGRPRVLYVDGDPRRADPLARALGAGGFDVDVRGASGAPQSAAALKGYDFYVLSDVPADALPSASTDAIERWVKRGGGFLMAGGENGFGLGGYRGTRMERILPVRMDAQRRRDQPTLALVLVLDKSGSMDGRKMQLAKEAARATAELLGPEDYIGVIGFDAKPTRVVRIQSAKNRIGVSRDIGRMAAGGGTAIFPALDAAYEGLSATRARVKHVILLTDGQTQESGIDVLVQNMRADGITVSSIGLGTDVNRSLLSQVARVGGGRSYFTSEPHNIPRLFVKETHQVSRSNVVEDYVQVRAVGSAAFLRGVPVQSAPYLRGYVATRAKPAPAQVVLASELGEPILARWRLGLGWTLAWTTDVKARWAADWLRWAPFSRLFAQLVREHMPPRPDRDLPLEASIHGDEARVVLDAIDDEDRFINGLQGELVVLGPLSHTNRSAPPEAARVPIPQVAPGRYEAQVPLPGFGTFLLRAELKQGEQRLIRASGSLSHPFPAEYGGLAPDAGRLSAIARAGGGRLLDGPVEDAFDPRGEDSERLQPLWPLCIWLALALFVADLALRRVRWFDRRTRG